MIPVHFMACLALHYSGNDCPATVIPLPRPAGPPEPTLFSSPGSSLCDGTETDAVDCPCANPTGTSGDGCLNSTTVGARLRNTGGNSVSADDTVLLVDQLPTNQNCFVYYGPTMWYDSGTGLFGIQHSDGIRCLLAGTWTRMDTINSGSTGSIQYTNVASSEGFTTGITRYFQAYYRDSTHGSCTSHENFSNTWQITFR